VVESVTIIGLPAGGVILPGMSDTPEEPSRAQLDMAIVLAALADRSRLATVRALATAGEAACGEVPAMSGLTVSKSTISHHLRILRQAGIIHTRRAGSRRYVSLRRDDLDLRFPGLFNAVLTEPDLPAQRSAS
jgi:DNA-binding transcriptional ArsR family regulator